VLHRGARTAVAQATLTDSRGKLLAHATSTLMLFGGPSR
jgi:acyl-coenzyme A thioesterase PaaI-like protein